MGAEKTTLAGLSDEDLVRRFQEGRTRDAAFDAIFERHAAVSYAFLRRRIGDPELAAEHNQELWVSVLRGLPSFRGEASFRTWLFRMAHNRLHQLRRRLRVHLDERADRLPDTLLEDVAGADDPAATADRGQTVRRLRRCLARLSEVERAVVFGQYYMEQTLEQLTRALRLTNRSGARAVLLAAQRKLKRCLSRAGFAPAPQGGRA